MKNLILISLVAFTLTLNAQNFQSYSFSGGHTTAKTSDGTIWGWGYASSGQLASFSENELVPIKLSQDRDWKVIQSGIKNTFAIKENGTLWACGNNEFGSLGINSELESVNTFQQVGESSNWIKVAPSYLFTVALKSNGTIWAWGQNDSNQLGNKSKNTKELSPIQIGDASNWIDIATTTNKTAFAIKEDGTIWAWGLNDSNLIVSDSRVSNTYLPTQVNNDRDWVRIEAGKNHILAQKKDGTLWSWGESNMGQLGNGEFRAYTHDTQIVSTDTWLDFSAGLAVSFGIKSDGTLWAWGRNNFGQLGDGTTENRFDPVQIGTDNNWFSVQAKGFQSTMLTKADGTVWYMGWNTFGTFGNGTVANASTPTKNMNINILDKQKVKENSYYASIQNQKVKMEEKVLQANLDIAIKGHNDVTILDKK
jgi:alpha-tubulin suppressor-like RCC1 family protein